MSSVYFNILNICLQLIFGSFVSIYGQINTKEITNEDIWMSGKFFPKTYSDALPLKDGEHYLVSEDNGLVVYSYKTGISGKS